MNIWNIFFLLPPSLTFSSSSCVLFGTRFMDGGSPALQHCSSNNRRTKWPLKEKKLLPNDCDNSCNAEYNTITRTWNMALSSSFMTIQYNSTDNKLNTHISSSRSFLFFLSFLDHLKMSIRLKDIFFFSWSVHNFNSYSKCLNRISQREIITVLNERPYSNVNIIEIWEVVAPLIATLRCCERLMIFVLLLFHHFITLKLFLVNARARRAKTVSKYKKKTARKDQWWFMPFQQITTKLFRLRLWVWDE